MVLGLVTQGSGVFEFLLIFQYQSWFLFSLWVLCLCIVFLSLGFCLSVFPVFQISSVSVFHVPSPSLQFSLSSFLPAIKSCRYKFSSSFQSPTFWSNPCLPHSLPWQKNVTTLWTQQTQTCSSVVRKWLGSARSLVVLSRLLIYVAWE